MTRRPVVTRLVQAASLAGFPGIPLLLLIGLVLLVAWVVTSRIQGSAADWYLVAVVWLTLLFVFAIAGVLVEFLLPRIIYLRRGQGRYVAGNLWLMMYVSVVPCGAFASMIFQLHGTPVWLYVLGGISVVLGVAAYLDPFMVRRPAGTKRKGGRRG